MWGHPGLGGLEAVSIRMDGGGRVEHGFDAHDAGSSVDDSVVYGSQGRGRRGRNTRLERGGVEMLTVWDRP